MDRPNTYSGAKSPTKTSQSNRSNRPSSTSLLYHHGTSSLLTTSTAQRALQSIQSRTSTASSNRPPMTNKSYQSDLIMPAITSRKLRHELSPLHLRSTSKIKTKARKKSPLSRHDRLWKPTNGTADKSSWIESFALENSLFESKAVWGTTKMIEVLELCGVPDLDDEDDDSEPQKMRSIAAIEILRQVRSNFGTGSTSGNMALFRKLAAALFPGISPLKRITNTLEAPNSVSTQCNICTSNCGLFNNCSGTCLNIYFCSECTELLGICPTCYSSIEIGHGSIRLQLEPTTKQMEMVNKQTQPLQQWQMKDFVQLRTWYEHERILIDQCRDVASWKPMIAEFDRKRKEERLKEIRVLSASTKAWQISIIGIVFRRWANCLKKVKDAQKKMMNFLNKLKGINLKTLIREWSTVARREKLRPAASASKTLSKKLEEHKIEIDKKENRINYLIERIEVQKDIVKKVNQDVIEHEELFSNPANSPPTLQRVLYSLSKSSNSLLSFAEASVNNWSQELTRKGIGTYRLGYPVVDATPSMVAISESNKEQQDTKYRRPSSPNKSKSKGKGRKKSIAEKEKAMEDENNSRGLPRYGQQLSVWTSQPELEQSEVHIDEDVMYPFESRIGLTMLKWLNNIVANQITSTLKKKTSTNHTVPKIEKFQDLLGGVGYFHLLNSIIEHGSCSGNDAFSNAAVALKGISETTPQEELCEAVALGFHSSIRILTADDMMQDEEEEEEVQDNPEKTKNNGKSSKRNRPEIITKQTTVINGVKVDCEDDAEQRHFAFMAHVLATHRGFSSGASDMDGIPWETETPESSAGNAKLKLDQYLETTNLAMNLIENSSKTTTSLGVSTKIELLKGPTNDLEQCKEKFSTPTTDLFLKYRTVLYERLQLNDFDLRSSHLSFLGCYQAVLGRDTQIEEDLDDGTFTGRHIGEQLGDLMRADISLSTGERGMTPMECKESIARLQEFLLTHFRSTIMIFDHYSAQGHSGKGGSGSMDRGEFWKLIKDVGLHRQLSGAEIDLIFQKSNLDNSMSKGTAALDSELEGHEFVEAIIRLAVCKYTTSTKKSNLTDWETKFETFFIQDLLRSAKQTNKAGFRENVLTNSQVKSVLKQHRSKIKKIFTHFAAVDTSNINVTNQHTSSTINAKELLIAARTLGCMRPGILTDTTVRTLFSHVQMNEDTKGKAAGDDEEMNFEEFKEVLCAMAFMLSPNPWIPAHKRLRQFLENIFSAAVAGDILHVS